MILSFLSPSGGEIILILIAVLLLFGADKIPELARGLGKGIREIKNATSDIQREVTKGVGSNVQDLKRIRDEIDITKDIQNDIKDTIDKKL